MGLMLLTILGVIVVVTGIAWLMGTDPLAPGNWSGQANEAIGPWRFTLMVFRWALWALLWWRWNAVGRRLFRGDSEVRIAQRQQWSRMRKRMMGAIAIVETLILISTITGG